MEIELKIKSLIRFFILLFCAVISMICAIALYEPDCFIAVSESVLLMIIAGISIFALYLEVKD